MRSTHDPLTALDARDCLALLDVSADWMWATDAEHRFISFSDSIKSAVGYDPKELIGLSRPDLILNKALSRTSFAAHLDDLRQHRPFRDFIYENEVSAGRTVWISVSGTPRFDGDGRFLGYVGTGRNLSGRAREHSALQAATQRVGQSEHLMRSIFDSLAVGVVVFDAEERLLATNPALETMIPMIADRLQTGMPLEDVVGAFVDANAVAPLSETAQTDRSDIISKRVATFRTGFYDAIERISGGRVVHHVVRRSDNGLLISLRTDITNELRKEDQLAEMRQSAEDANARLRAAVDAMPEGFAIWDQSDRLVSCNDAYRKAVSSGITIEDGQTYRQMVTDLACSGMVREAIGCEREWIEERIRERSAKAEIESVYCNHFDRWYLHRDVRMPNGERVDIRMDITDLKRREATVAAALEQAKLSQDAINAIPEPLFVKDKSLRYVLVNDAFVSLLGKSAQDVLGKRADDLIQSERAARYHAAESNVLRTGQLFEVEEDHVEGGFGKTRISRKARITGHSGERYVLSYLLDVTEIRERERQLERAKALAQSAEQAKSRFLSNMSHQIRTPVSNMIAMSESLKRTDLALRERTLADVLHKSGEILLGMIDDILEFSRLEAGELTARQESFAVGEIVEDVLRQSVMEASFKDLALVPLVDKEIDTEFLGDGSRIRQILTNLVSNAIKFTDRGSVVVYASVTADDGDRQLLRLSVRDTGAGLSRKQAETLLDSYLDTPQDATRSGDTGLGLAITTRLVRMLGGDFSLDSEEGSGSVFTVSIPVHAGAALAVEGGDGPPLSGRSILIVDIHGDQARAIRQAIEIAGGAAVSVDTLKMAEAFLSAADHRGFQLDALILGPDFEPETLREHLSGLVHVSPAILTARMIGALLPGIGDETRDDLSIALPLRSEELVRTLAAVIERSDAPLADQPPVASNLDDITPTKDVGPPIDLLVAEDNPINQLVYVHILGRLPLSFELVGNGLEAVEAYRLRRPPIVFLDAVMPDMCGPEAARIIRDVARANGDQVAIVAVASSQDLGSSADWDEGLIDEHLIKPVTAETVQMVIESVGDGVLRRTGS